VGPRAHRERIAVETRPSSVTTHGGKVYAATGAGAAPRRSAHARAIIACDFCVAVTSTFRVLYVLVVIEHHSRRLIHVNVTAHPSAQWTLQQLREAVGYEKQYAYLLHDRDTIFSAELDESIRRLGLRVLRSPPRSPKANALCERVLGTLRRECLDWLIPLSEAHLRQTIKLWVAHYNRGRPHSALGPGVPDPPTLDCAIVEVATSSR
jgi:putative transposase